MNKLEKIAVENYENEFAVEIRIWFEFVNMKN